MKKLLMGMLSLILSAGSLLAIDIAAENLLIKNATKKNISYEFVTKLKSKSPTSNASGEIKAGETLAFQPSKEKATLNFYTDGGKTVKTTVKSTGYLVIDKISDKEVKFTKETDKKNPTTALLDSITE